MPLRLATSPQDKRRVAAVEHDHGGRLATVDDELEALHQLGGAAGIGADRNSEIDEAAGDIEAVEHVAVTLEGAVRVATHQQRHRQSGPRGKRVHQRRGLQVVALPAHHAQQRPRLAARAASQSAKRRHRSGSIDGPRRPGRAGRQPAATRRITGAGSPGAATWQRLARRCRCGRAACAAPCTPGAAAALRRRAVSPISARRSRAVRPPLRRRSPSLLRKRDSISRLHSRLMRRGMPPVQRWISLEGVGLEARRAVPAHLARVGGGCRRRSRRRQRAEVALHDRRGRAARPGPPEATSSRSSGWPTRQTFSGRRRRFALLQFGQPVEGAAVQVLRFVDDQHGAAAVAWPAPSEVIAAAPRSARPAYRLGRQPNAISIARSSSSASSCVVSTWPTTRREDRVRPAACAPASSCRRRSRR